MSSRATRNHKEREPIGCMTQKAKRDIPELLHLPTSILASSSSSCSRQTLACRSSLVHSSSAYCSARMESRMLLQVGHECSRQTGCRTHSIHLPLRRTDYFHRRIEVPRILLDCSLWTGRGQKRTVRSLRFVVEGTTKIPGEYRSLARFGSADTANSCCSEQTWAAAGV